MSARGPLAPRKPEGTARELPNGWGFLRVVQGSGGPPSPDPSPGPTPPSAAAAQEPAVSAGALAATVAPVEPDAVPTDDRQLDLFAWRPKPAPAARQLPAVGSQLSLFGNEP